MDRVSSVEQTALARALAGVTSEPAEVDALVQVYRSGKVPSVPVMGTGAAARAYAAYRMPATFAGVRHALAQASAAMPGFAPISATDLGAGTGASAWALAATWPSLTDLRLLEQAAAARQRGEQVAGPRTGWTWQAWRLGDDAPARSDVACAAYVLGELSTVQQSELVATLLATAGTVVVVEAGTPAGYRRMLRAREQLLLAGLTVAAPCPHDGPCPLAATTDDWCHTATRVDRTTTHRALKGGELMWEDEKVSYVVATREPVVRPTARVLRHPAQRKGLVTFELCRGDGTVGPELVSRRQGERFTAARATDWGDGWAEHD